MPFPAFDTIKSLSKDYALVPVCKIISAANKSPGDVFKIVKRVSKHAFILESADDYGKTGRYTFIGYDPKMELTVRDWNVHIKNGAEITIATDDPAVQIRDILAQNRSPKLPELPPFAGGLVGYFTYDSIKYAEPTLDFVSTGSQNASGHFNDIDLMYFDKVIAFDHQSNKIWIIYNIKTIDLEEHYNNAVRVLEDMASLIENGTPYNFQPLTLKSDFRLMFSEDEYCKMVEKAKRYIVEGDIFQVVLANRLEAEADGSLFDAYKALQEMNPSPYMFYFSSDSAEIAGAAPETLVKLDNNTVSTYPLAGTRPRGKTPEEDVILETDLRSNSKELAEHNMLVDLGRNDIGRISKFASVRVEKYMDILRFSHVMHIGSIVSGDLRDDKDAVDAIKALLPAGTLSGAPKIRACEIINELEGESRGIYGGAIGYLAFNGDMDTCIAIRIAYKRAGKVTIRAGAGIVADSIPKNEFNECQNKMQAAVKAVKAAEGGLGDGNSCR